MDSSRSLEIETSAIVCAAFVGALGWDCATALLYDVRLLFSRSWLRSPIRVLSRLAYILSRYCALASLMLNLSYWYYPHINFSYCQRIPYVVEALMAFSYLNTLVVLMLRTLALYPTSKKQDWSVFYIILISFTSNAVFAVWLPFNVRGSRVPDEPTRCQFTQISDDKILKGFLITGVIYDIIVLVFTVYKLYSSEAYHFYTRHTFVGRRFLRSDMTMQETPLTKMAAGMIGSGLYDFAAITLVALGALISYLAITIPSYEATTLNCIGAISAALAGGVFRDTAKAAKTIQEVQKQQEKMQQLMADQKERSSFDRSEPLQTTWASEGDQGVRLQSRKRKSSSTLPKQTIEGRLPALEGIAIEFSCPSSRLGSPSTCVEEIRDSLDEERRFKSQSGTVKENTDGTIYCQRQAGTPEAVSTFDRYLSPDSQQIVDNRRQHHDDLMPLQVSLRAFDDGAWRIDDNKDMETLATVSVIGGSTCNDQFAFSSIREREPFSNMVNPTPVIGLPPPPRVANRGRPVVKQ